MSSQDSGQSRPDTLAHAWPQAPLADGSVNAAIATALANGAAAAVWSLEDGRALWWNEAGAPLFGLPGAQGAGDIAPALERAAGMERPWLERRRLSIGRRPCLATFQFSKAGLQGGGEGLLAIAVRLDPPIVVRGRATPPAPAVPLASREAQHLTGSGEEDSASADTGVAVA